MAAACVFPCDTVVVVGGGLAGVSACNTVLELGGKTVLIDKSSFCGGNSTKATSGINGAGTRTQREKKIDDSKELFTQDTLKGGAKRPEIVKVLCENSGADVEWLMDKFDLDLSLVARLGGHSAPRTHRGKERFPGMTITYALIQMVEKVAEVSDRARIITKARAKQLLMSSSGSCIGLVYEKAGEDFREHGPVVLASGGFGADFTSNSLLAQYRPDLMHLPTTNGEHCTGDGIKMGEAIGAKTIDLEWVQVHPTGLVKPDDPDAKIKFLAAEALRGVGGIILNKEGERFANELGRRDYVTGEMWKNKPPFRLCLNKAASDEIIWHCKHYTGRGVMKFYESGKALAADMGVPVEKIAAVHDQHFQASKKQEQDPEGGQYPAYPSGKTHDEPSGKTGSGKKFFHNVIPGSQFASEPFYVAIITPVIHYCMGGLEIDANSLVLSKATGKAIPGLYAAGEVAGGVHGNNRLGGNSLLDCVVFGRVSGKHAIEYILGKGNTKATDLKQLAAGAKLPAAVAEGKKEYRCEQVIVVGGGLAGVSACNTILENGGKSLLVDKSSFCGGNSTKATSGINGAATRTQREKKIEDSKELFTSDTLKGGAKKPEIVKVLCENSGADVEWLMDAFNLDLSLVARLGGHSAPRTHRGKERFPGMTITYALIQMVEKISECSDRSRITTKSRAHKLIMNGANTCVGLTYEKSGIDFNEYGPVILASGGFGADFTSNSLLAQYRPDLMHLPTTNGEHCTGDGIKMGEAIGAKTIDLEWVQVHPTGLVKPDDPDAKIKFLAAEALRGVGGIILNKEGERFANELGRRDYVTGEMWKNKPPFRLCLNKAASDEIIWHCKHYTGRGVMKFYESGKALAADMGVPVEKIAAVHDQHYQASKKQEKDPEGGSYPAYPSGKTWDEPSGLTGSGKKFFHNVIPGSQFASEPFYVAIITPVIHYCMGGLEIDANSLVLSKATGKAIPGLYAAGEVAGGVHGNNRLGGNSLLDCVVFGRVSGKHAIEYILGKGNTKATDLKQLAAGAKLPAAVAEGKKEYRCEQVIVVGGGLAGVSACNTILENGGKSLLVDKSSFCGGNSTKATSGINGAATRTQREKKIEDSKELFTSDTLKGGAKKPEIVKVLCENSGADVEWLMDAFNLDLSLVARLGGHSAPRTHRGKERFPGMTITYALIQMVEKVSECSDRSRITTKSRAHKLIMNGANTCVGLTYEKAGVDFNEYGPVILASGGFGADFTSNSLLAQYRPDLMHLPTTNGEHCTGDGIKMGEAIGAKTIDLEWVQVHPTGLVKPDDPDAKIKFLAAEALRGVGGIILNKEGERFANELGRRDYVTGEMWKNKPPFRLCLNKAASDEIIWHCKHYTGRGVMKFYESGKALAADMGVPVEKIAAVHDQHFQASKKQEQDPEGGQYPAYPSGKTHDEPSGKTGSGKKFFHNVIPGSQFASEPFYVAIITPVIHYCMGGLEIDANSVVLNKSTGKPIAGLYAAGEVAGGVHGNNRLGGNSLLDCVVFGRVSGKHACQWMLGKDVKATDLKNLSKGGLSGQVKGSSLAGGSYEDDMNEAKKPGAAAAAAPAAGGVQGFSMDEVAKHTTESDCWVVVEGQVLNVTNFLSSHPGGVLAIVTFGGKDATEEFNMIHPPGVIEKYAPDVVIGVVGEGTSGGGGGSALPALPAGQNYYSASEVAKHTTKNDCWVIINGDVLNVTNFLGEHPGGELAILTFGGKDATEEFDMIHPPGVIAKYAPDVIIGKVGEAPAGAAAAAAPAPARRKDKGDLHANHQAWGQDGSKNWRIEGYDDNPGVFIINVKSYFYATIHLWVAIIMEVLKTIFCNKNFKINAQDRVGLTRSAILLILFIVIHAVGNLHVFAGPDDFNGYGYFYVRLYWTGFGLPANIVEEYILLSALLHVTAGLAKTWGKIGGKGSIIDGNLNLGMTGVVLLVFMTIHLFQFRFGDTKTYFLRPPPYLVFFSGITKLQLFWTTDDSVAPVPVRDIYRLEFDRFLGEGTSKNTLWAYYYIFSTIVFFVHASLGWRKVIRSPAMAIPALHHWRVQVLGVIIFFVLMLVYISFPAYVLIFGRDIMCGKSTVNAANPASGSLNTASTGNDYSVCPA